MDMQPEDLAAWRADERKRLLAARTALPLALRREQDERLTESLLGFALPPGLVVGFYWPMKAEFDCRAAVERWRTSGCRVALPVVVRKAAPMEFREWWPGIETAPGVFGLPIPQGSAKVVPDVVLMPPVGFDAGGYRLGYGGGYFDRTLATLSPQPLKIGVAREATRIATIHPQAWDIPMDFVVTEGGIYQRTATGLERLERPREAGVRAAELLDKRRAMNEAEVCALLNALLEAERAGAKVLAAYLEEQGTPPALKPELARIQRDESRNCAVLLRLLRRMGAEASRQTGGFFRAALAVEGTQARLEFLNRGQAWVAKRLAAATPRIVERDVRKALEDMRVSHIANIAACESLLRGMAAPRGG